MKPLCFYFLALLFLFPLTQLTAQEVEVYPGGIPLSATERADIPVLQLSSQSAATPLPSSVLNNEKIYFPPIYDQTGTGFCAQASESDLPLPTK